MKREQSSDEEDDIWEYKTRKRLKNRTVNVSNPSSKMVEKEKQSQKFNLKLKLKKPKSSKSDPSQTKPKKPKSSKSDPSQTKPKRQQKTVKRKNESSKTAITPRTKGIENENSTTSQCRNESSKTTIPPRTKGIENENSTTSQCQNDVVVGSAEASKNTTKIRHSQKKCTPVKPRETYKGNCPSCQMPLSLLNIQTPNCHVTECLDSYEPSAECSDGIQCDNTIESHYKKFSHHYLALARSHKECDGSSVPSPVSGNEHICEPSNEPNTGSKGRKHSAKVKLEFSDTVDGNCEPFCDRATDNDVTKPTDHSGHTKPTDHSGHPRVSVKVTMPVTNTPLVVNITCSQENKVGHVKSRNYDTTNQEEMCSSKSIDQTVNSKHTSSQLFCENSELSNSGSNCESRNEIVSPRKTRSQTRKSEIGLMMSDSETNRYKLDNSQRDRLRNLVLDSSQKSKLLTIKSSQNTSKQSSSSDEKKYTGTKTKTDDGELDEFDFGDDTKTKTDDDEPDEFDFGDDSFDISDMIDKALDDADGTEDICLREKNIEGNGIWKRSYEGEEDTLLKVVNEDLCNRRSDDASDSNVDDIDSDDSDDDFSKTQFDALSEEKDHNKKKCDINYMTLDKICMKKNRGETTDFRDRKFLRTDSGLHEKIKSRNNKIDNEMDTLTNQAVATQLLEDDENDFIDLTQDIVGEEIKSVKRLSQGSLQSYVRGGKMTPLKDVPDKGARLKSSEKKNRKSMQSRNKESPLKSSQKSSQKKRKGVSSTPAGERLTELGETTPVKSSQNQKSTQKKRKGVSSTPAGACLTELGETTPVKSSQNQKSGQQKRKGVSSTPAGACLTELGETTLVKRSQKRDRKSASKGLSGSSSKKEDLRKVKSSPGRLNQTLSAPDMKSDGNKTSSNSNKQTTIMSFFKSTCDKQVTQTKNLVKTDEKQNFTCIMKKCEEEEVNEMNNNLSSKVEGDHVKLKNRKNAFEILQKSQSLNDNKSQNVAGNVIMEESKTSFINRKRDSKSVTTSEISVVTKKIKSVTNNKNDKSSYEQAPSAVGGSGTAQTGGRRYRQCPFYKKIPDTPFTVDAFSYGDIPGCSAYFLSHFHYDHYNGLRKSFSNQLYCCKITANLVRSKIKVDTRYINELPMNTPVVVEGVEVTLLEANHCPGSVLMLFKLKNGRVILHTGDFRADPSMERYPELTGVKVSQLYLDTTYCDPAYAFPVQQDAIDFGVSLVLKAIQRNPKTLIVCGSYTIGKERIFIAIAKALNCKICVMRDKKNVLDCIEDPYLMNRISLNWEDSQLHVLPMGKLNQKGLKEHTSKLNTIYTSILALEPTGWTYNNKLVSLEQIKPKYKREDITIYGVPYSEHSSFLELKRFVQFLKPDKILPTVNNGNPNIRKKMELAFKSWKDELGNKSASSSKQSSMSNWLM